MTGKGDGRGRKRVPGGQRIWIGVASALALTTGGPRVARAELPSAKVAHEQAVGAVRTQDLERAKRAFLMAYIEAPRPILLYNLGLACRDLGQLEEARRYLRRFLAEANLPSDDSTRNTAEEELAKLDAELPPESPSDTRVDASEQAELSCPAVEPPAKVMQQSTSVDLGAARWRGAALGVTGFGALTAAAGVALYLVGGGKSGETPNSFQDGAWQQRSQDLQIGGIVLMAAGGVLTIAGVTTWFVVGDETKVEVGAGRMGLATRF